MASDEFKRWHSQNCPDYGYYYICAHEGDKKWAGEAHYPEEYWEKTCFEVFTEHNGRPILQESITSYIEQERKEGEERRKKRDEEAKERRRDRYESLKREFG